MAFTFNGSPAATLPLRALVSVPLTALALCALLAVGVAYGADSPNTYRYRDNNGQVVYGATVPPQFVKNGYEVLNERGIVIQTVQRALTAEELALLESTREQREAEEAEVRRREEADNLLLRLYRAPDEIARKRDERVTLIDGQLTALLASLGKLETEVATLQKAVDDDVAAGREPPPLRLDTLRIQREELNRVLTQRERLQSDRATVVADADRDMRRLAELMGLPPPDAAASEPSAELALPEDSETD